MARLTKEERMAIRPSPIRGDDSQEFVHHDVYVALLDSLGAADAEIERLTTALEECDKREREAQEALQAMRDENKRLRRNSLTTLAAIIDAVGGELVVPYEAFIRVDNHDEIVSYDDEERMATVYRVKRGDVD
jgi:hypothetical protein